MEDLQQALTPEPWYSPQHLQTQQQDKQSSNQYYNNENYKLQSKYLNSSQNIRTLQQFDDQKKSIKEKKYNQKENIESIENNSNNHFSNANINNELNFYHKTSYHNYQNKHGKYFFGFSSKKQKKQLINKDNQNQNKNLNNNASNKSQKIYEKLQNILPTLYYQKKCSSLNNKNVKSQSSQILLSDQQYSLLLSNKHPDKKRNTYNLKFISQYQKRLSKPLNLIDINRTISIWKKKQQMEKFLEEQKRLKIGLPNYRLKIQKRRLMNYTNFYNNLNQISDISVLSSLDQIRYPFNLKKGNSIYLKNKNNYNNSNSNNSFNKLNQTFNSIFSNDNINSYKNDFCLKKCQAQNYNLYSKFNLFQKNVNQSKNKQKVNFKLKKSGRVQNQRKRKM